MSKHIETSAITLYLVACVMLGGASRAGYLANFALEVFGIAFLCWGLWRASKAKLDRQAWFLVGIAGGVLGLILVQFMPIPWELWKTLPGRGEIAAELDLLGVKPSPALVTLSLHESLRSATSLIPALGLGAVLLTSDQLPRIQTAAALALLSLIALGLGLAQTLGGNENPWYFYSFTNRGSMVGAFANANHMATFLLVSTPFVAALVAEGRMQIPKHKWELTLLGVAFIALITIGVGLVGSGTGYLLLAPVVLSSGFIIWKPSKRLILICILPIIGLSFTNLAFFDEANFKLSDEADASMASREQITATALPVAQEFFPLGSGLGTFEEVYRRYEDKDAISQTFINHAHNDYLEIAIELGLPGVILIGLFLVWFFSSLRHIMAANHAPFSWAAWIAIGVILTHSGWDYPLRTAALGSTFALCCVLCCRRQFAQTNSND